MGTAIQETHSHACIHDCSLCMSAKGIEPVAFAQEIRNLIEFPEAPINCAQTKVDLSCFFGGRNFASGNEQKQTPTLVEKQNTNPIATTEQAPHL